ncbi:polysaccharide ABC transporter ATP-binding protein [Opitutales bacterium]|nr:polysaccharide ABC transporter ATP-binding protein [Opitutales bacterium]
MPSSKKNQDCRLIVRNLSKRFNLNPEKVRSTSLLDVLRHMFLHNPETERGSEENEFWAVKDVSFTLKKGESLGVMGMNGAGKSTLLKMLLGRLDQDEGEMEIEGKIGGLIELSAGMHPELSGRENIYNKARLMGVSKKEILERIDDIVEFADIGDFIDSPVKTYSSGMHVRLGFSVTAFFQTDFVLCDEVLAVGDFDFRQKCLHKINQLRRDRGFVLVSHSAKDISVFCDKVMVLHKGSCIFFGEPEKGIEIFYKLDRHMEAEEAKKISSALQTESDQESVEFHTNPLKEDSDDKEAEDLSLELKNELFWPEYHKEELIDKIEMTWNLPKKDGKFIYVPGAKFVMTLRYVLKQNIENARVGIPFFDEHGQMIFGPDTRGVEERFLLNNKGLKEIVFELPSLPVNEGRFWVTVSICDDPAQIFRKHLSFFDVPNESGKFGKIEIKNSKWAIG